MAGTMRFAKCAVGVCLVTSLSCSGLGEVSGDFATAAADAQADAGCRIELDGSRIVELSAPIRAADLPQTVARAVESIQPGGSKISVAQVWRSSDVAYRIETEYVNGRSTELRSVLLDEDGQVIERSHQVSLREVGRIARLLVADLDRGETRRVEVVQQGAGEESYRFHLRLPDGRRTIVRCGLDGGDMRVARALPVELRAWVAP